MQYKFKYSGSTDTRKSGNNHHSQGTKNQLLPYFNILDKCTQILREDRIWLRNQIKLGNEDIISILKQAKKPLNLQHLQIKLRKHVTTVKNKAKMEQLMKFKQNMNLGDWNKSRDQPEKYNESIDNKDNKKNFSHSSIEKVVHNSTSLTHHNKSYKARINHSIEKPEKPVIYPYRNTNSNLQTNTRKPLQQYNVPMQEITERESQNVTSARHRNQIEQHVDNGSFGMTYTYNQWKRPNNFTSPLEGLKEQLKSETNPFKSPVNMVVNKLNDYKPEIVNSNKIQPKQYSPETDIYEHYYGGKSNNKQQNKLEYNYYENSASYGNITTNIQQYPTNIQQYPTNIQQYPTNIQQYPRADQQIQNHCDSLFQKQHESSFDRKFNYQNSVLYQQSQQEYSQSYIPEKSANSQLSHKRAKSNQRDNDSLFTSPQLLQECRNFIKNKSSAKSSIQKQNNYLFPKNTYDYEYKYTPLSFDQPQAEPTYQKIEQQYLNGALTKPYSTINCGFIQSIKVSEPTSNEKGFEDLHGMQLKIKNKIDGSHEVPEDFNKTYEFFHTFANQSSHKKQVRKQHFTYAEQFVDQILSRIEDEVSGYIKWTTLLRIVEKKCPQFVTTFIEYLKPEPGEQFVLISNGGRVMEDLLQSEHQTDNEVNSIYRLLDIQQKGYISQQDISDFITQLQDAEAEDVQNISQSLWRLFDSIDEDSEESEEKRIDYWGIYSRKQGRQFGELSQLLKQFQFQIE